jgi:hypothetical protein
MQNEGENTAHQQSNLSVEVTYMPAVIDKGNSEQPGVVDGGVWYKAVVRLASAPETGKVPKSTPGDVDSSGLVVDLCA